jgi:hypothetical protein
VAATTGTAAAETLGSGATVLGGACAPDFAPMKARIAAPIAAAATFAAIGSQIATQVER